MVFSPQDLAQLRDIHLPKPIHWWPLAPGWYVMTIILILISMIMVKTLYRRSMNNRAKRIALQTLAHYQQDKSPLMSAKVSELLKQVALAYYPREKVAHLHGEAWLTFLNSTARGVNFDSVRVELLETPYRTTTMVDLQPLFKTAFNWIKKQGRPCSN